MTDKIPTYTEATQRLEAIVAMLKAHSTALEHCYNCF